MVWAGVLEAGLVKLIFNGRIHVFQVFIACVFFLYCVIYCRVCYMVFSVFLNVWAVK